MSVCGATNVTPSASTPQSITGPAGREPVARRARRGADDHRVTGQLAEVDAVDVPAQARDAPLEVAGDDDVVHGHPGAHAVALHLDRRELDHLQLAGERAPHRGLELVRLRRREESDAAEVDAEDGHAAPGHRAAARAGQSRRRRARSRGRPPRSRPRAAPRRRLPRPAGRRAPSPLRRPGATSAPRGALSGAQATASRSSGRGSAGAPAASGWSRETMLRKNSRLPAGPGWPLSQAPRTTPPASRRRPRRARAPRRGWRDRARRRGAPRCDPPRTAASRAAARGRGARAPRRAAAGRARAR